MQLRFALVSKRGALHPLGVWSSVHVLPGRCVIADGVPAYGVAGQGDGDVGLAALSRAMLFVFHYHRIRCMFVATQSEVMHSSC